MASATPLLTLDEVAAYLRTSPSTIYNWRHAGKGPRCMKVGRNLRFRQDDVDAWLDEQAVA